MLQNTAEEKQAILAKLLLMLEEQEAVAVDSLPVDFPNQN